MNWPARIVTAIAGKMQVRTMLGQRGRETSLIVSSNIENLVEKVFKNEQCLHKFTNLTAISVRLPMEDTTLWYQEFITLFFQRLAWEGVRLNEVISTTNEFTFIIPEEQEKVTF